MSKPPTIAPPTFALVSLGCKVNQYETQAIRERMLAAGYVPASPHRPADVTIVNTCAVTEQAARKCRQQVYRAVRRNRAGRVIVTGCLAAADPAEWGKVAAVAQVVPKEEAGRIPALLAGEPEGVEPGAPAFDLAITRFADHARAFLKIQDGCDAFCSYCIVPHVRGRARNRPLPDVVTEARRLVASGHREIVLTGIHLGVYGRGLDEEVCLEDAIEAVLAVEGLQRLRLSSLEPNEVSDRLLDIMSGEPRLCPHLHLPLQSGDDDVLRAMNRRYSAADFLAVVERVRGRIDNPSLTTDVLVGFPGETDRQFAHTLAVCREAGFSRTHVFSYSARAGTPAAKMPGRIDPRVARARADAVEALAADLALNYKRRFIGRVVQPLVEERRNADNRLCGYTERYLRVLFRGPNDVKNRIVPVTVESADADALHGRIQS